MIPAPLAAGCVPPGASLESIALGMVLLDEVITDCKLLQTHLPPG